MYPSQRVKELKEEGNLTEAWIYGYAELQKNPEDTFLRRSLYWLCYGEIKIIQESTQGRDNQAPTGHEQERVNKLLGAINKLEMPIPSDEVKYLLWQFKSNGEHYKGFVDLILTDGEKLFSEEDYQPYKAEKGEAPSLVVRSARKVAAAYLSHRDEWGIDQEKVIALLEHAKSKALDKNKIWLHYDHAKCLIADGRYSDARKIALVVLRAKPSESWAWGALAATYRKDNPVAAIACFCKGISCAHEPPFTIPLRKGLIALLVNNGSHDLASLQVKYLVDIYNANGWRLKEDIENLIASDWYEPSVDTQDVDGYIKERAKEASQYLVEGADERVGVVESLHRSGRGFNVYVLPGKKYAVKKTLLAKGIEPEPGQWYKLAISRESDNEIIAVSPIEPQKSENIDVRTGTMKMHPKGYAFVDDVFLAPHLAKQELDGMDVVVTCIWDKKPNCDANSWRGIKVELPK